LNQSVLYNILRNPNENGIVVFVLGILFVLSIYHLLLYFQQKGTSYLYYSLYTSLIFIGHLVDVKTGFIPEIIRPFKAVLSEIDIEITWIYNMLYFVFAYTFLNLKDFSKKWYHIIFRAIYLLFFICVVFEITYRISGNENIINSGNSFFIIYLTALGVISYIPLFKIRSPLKYYIIVGSTFLFGSSLAATIIHRMDLFPEANQISFSIFYIGVVLENILFTLGLGHKQKLILKEKNNSQKKLIEQYKENEILRLKINDQLQQDVVNLNKKAEAEKLEALKIAFQKEVTDLKMASLRSHMNPHFIFNSLDSIKRYIIENETENAVYYLNKFSKLIRKVLATTKEKEVTLVDELETSNLYMTIENIRFNNEIELVLNVAKDLPLETIKIPSLILQPFIENAIWHGLSLKKGKKILQINIEKHKETHFKISIIDNGIGREKSNQIMNEKFLKRESFGIKLTEERLAIFSKDFQNDYSLKFKDLLNDDKTAAGTEVVILIPLI